MVNTPSEGILANIKPPNVVHKRPKTIKRLVEKRSANGPYEELANSIAKAASDSYEKGESSPASVIANVMSKAVSSNNPKTRYVAGRLAKPLIFLRKYFGTFAEEVLPPFLLGDGNMTTAVERGVVEVVKEEFG